MCASLLLFHVESRSGLIHLEPINLLIRKATSTNDLIFLNLLTKNQTSLYHSGHYKHIQLNFCEVHVNLAPRTQRSRPAEEDVGKQSPSSLPSREPTSPISCHTLCERGQQSDKSEAGRACKAQTNQFNKPIQSGNELSGGARKAKATAWNRNSRSKPILTHLSALHHPSFPAFYNLAIQIRGKFCNNKKNTLFFLKKTRYICPIIRYTKYSELTQTSLTSEKTHCLLLCAQQLPQTPPKAQSEACKKTLCGLNNALKATDGS